MNTKTTYRKVVALALSVLLSFLQVPAFAADEVTPQEIQQAPVSSPDLQTAQPVESIPQDPSVQFLLNSPLSPAEPQVNEPVTVNETSPTPEELAIHNLDTNGDGSLTAVESYPVLVALLKALGKQIGDDGWDAVAKYDLDGNGAITGTDLMTHLDTFNANVSENERRRLVALQNLDTNKDGVLTANEAYPVLVDILKALGKQQGDDGWDAVAKYDLNGDGAITGTDLMTHLDAFNAIADEGERRRLVALQNLDTNKDGVLTANEAYPILVDILKALGKQQGDDGWDAVAKYDLNGDGAITGTDYIAHLNAFNAIANQTERAILKAIDVMDVDNNFVISAKEYIETNRAVLAALGKKVGDPGYNPAFDLDGNGVITPTDAVTFVNLKSLLDPQEARRVQAFIVMDKDHNLILTAREYIETAKAVIAALGTKAGEPGFNPAFDLDGNGAITPTDSITFINLKDFLDPTQARRVKAFEVADKNDDLTLTMSEYYETVRAVYAALGSKKGDSRYNPDFDLDSNGYITQTDVIVFINLREFITTAPTATVISTSTTLTASTVTAVQTQSQPAPDTMTTMTTTVAPTTSTIGTGTTITLQEPISITKAPSPIESGLVREPIRSTVVPVDLKPKTSTGLKAILSRFRLRL